MQMKRIKMLIVPVISVGAMLGFTAVYASDDGTVGWDTDEQTEILEEGEEASSSNIISHTLPPAEALTSEDYQQAKPVELKPVARPDEHERYHLQLQVKQRQRSDSVSIPAQPPAEASTDGMVPETLFKSSQERTTEEGSTPDAKRTADDGIAPVDAGGISIDAPFSSSRIVPLSADESYPYRAAGKLFFEVVKESGQRHVNMCSASVVSKRLVLTAGHCVHSGENGRDGWFRNIHFVPAYRDGVAPFGVWKARSIYTTQDWYESEGVVPNRADYALLVMEDQDNRTIGERIGWLGIKTEALHNNHVKMLGYPANIDRGEKMHQSNAAAAEVGLAETVLYGSNMGGGASGGPWIQNFGVSGQDEPTGERYQRNYVVGVSSYEFVDPRILVLGSSILDDGLLDMYRQACANAEGNCR